MTDPLEILRRHNEWRRGEEVAQVEPRELGRAIHAVIAELENRRTGECICKRCGLRQGDEHEAGGF